MKEVKQLLPIALVLLVIWWVYKRFVAGNPMVNIMQSVDEQVAKDSQNVMANGKTYYQTAYELVELMYDGAVIPWFSNTDEAAVGRIMLGVLPSEFNKLSQTYVALKDAAKHWYTVGTTGTLEYDLRKLFSKADLLKYNSHLFTA